MPPRQRVVLAFLCGLLAAAMSLRSSWTQSDFGPIWYAARALLVGENPYLLVGPGRAFDYPWPLLYPLPAAIVVTPLVALAEPAARAMFVFTGAALFAWTLMRCGYGPLFGFFSLAVRSASGAAQWSMLLAAAFAVPVASLLLAAKPTLGAALFVAQPRWRAVVAGVVLLAISFLLQPTWFHAWMDAITRNQIAWGPDTPYRPMVSFLGGPLILAALLRWRRPEARLIAAMACAPLSPEPYEMTPLFLVPRTFGESALLVGLSYVHPLLMRTMLSTPWSYGVAQPVAGALYVTLLYLPCMVMVLRRSNEGPAPAWLERKIVVWPSWLRGIGVKSERRE